MRLKISIALLLMFSVARVQALETDLNYTAVTGESSYIGGGAGLDFRTAPPAGKRVLPPANGAPLYATLRLSNTERLVMLDRADARDKWYGRLRIDLNADGDLTNDKPIDTRAEAVGKEYSSIATGNIEVTNNIGGKSVPYQFQISIFMEEQRPSLFGGLGKNPNDYVHASVRPRCCHLADFTVDSRQYQISFVDYNVNGQFHDSPTPGAFTDAAGDSFYFSGGDRMYIKSGGSFDMNGDQPFCKWLILGGGLFEINADFAAGKLTLNPIEAAATITLPPSILNMSMMRQDTYQSLAIYRPASQVKMPAGPWKMVSFQLERNDAQGDRWRILARGNSAAQPYKIEATTSMSLPIGEPFTPVIRIADGFSKQVTLVFSIKDRSQAQVTALSHEGNKTRIALSKDDPSLPKEPSWTAVTTTGEKVASGSFEYG